MTFLFFLALIANCTSLVRIAVQRSSVLISVVNTVSHNRLSFQITCFLVGPHEVLMRKKPVSTAPRRHPDPYLCCISTAERCLGLILLNSKVVTSAKAILSCDKIFS